MKPDQQKWLALGLPKEQEARYRQKYLHADANQAIVGLLILIIPLTAFIYNDYRLFGLTPEFYALAASRAIWLSFTVLLIRYLRRTKSYRNYDRLLLVWSIVGVAGIMLINLTRSQNFAMHAMIDTVIILIFYLVIPNKLINQIIAASLFTIGEGLVLTLDKDPSLQTLLFSLVFTFLLANAAGLVGAWRLQTFRRREFLAQEEEHIYRKELERLAKSDGLTGIYNSRAFMEMANRESNRFHRYGRSFTFIMMDIDHFKLINDTYGHQTGDSVLKQLVVTVTSQLRQIDIMGRLGGEEFGIILPETGRTEALRVAARILEVVRKMEVTAREGQIIKITISVGISDINVNDASPDAFIARADTAMYRAKRNGRDRVEAAEVAAN